MDKSHQVTSLVSVITYFIMNLRPDQEEEQASSVSGPSAAEQMHLSSPVTVPRAHRALLQSLASLAQLTAGSIPIPPGSTSEILSTDSLLV